MVVPEREAAAVAKNSPRSKVNGECSDGAVDVFGLPPELRGGAGDGDRSRDDVAFSFLLERPNLVLLGQLMVGQVVGFVRDAGSSIAATVDGQVIGFVPAAYRSRVSAILAPPGYSAMIQDIAHHMVRVRVTA